MFALRLRQMKWGAVALLLCHGADLNSPGLLLSQQNVSLDKNNNATQAQ